MCCHPMTARPRGLGPASGGSCRTPSLWRRTASSQSSVFVVNSLCASSSSSDSHSHSDPNRTQHLGAAHSTARHDSHRVHCHHQIGHIRELKSYTVIFHRNLKTKYLPQKQTIEKSKHDKNGQRRLDTSTTLQKCKRWFCFCRLCFFFSHVGRGGAVSFHHIPVHRWISSELASFLDLFWGIKHGQRTGAPWGKMAVTGWGASRDWATRHKQPQHTKVWSLQRVRAHTS